ncbi:hypothetical protein F2Q68_00014715 [Brassica cretica]|uniref:Uncharacterized protein n=1 Tax=Brassica cretica TaxID=69181 RepID=A0A8S9HJY1_BRACR|nr:hypothetical protein F2Q68_00014715 [Brassica cretica]
MAMTRISTNLNELEICSSSPGFVGQSSSFSRSFVERFGQLILFWLSLPGTIVTFTSGSYISLIHAYAVGRDMEEGIEMSLVTYSVIVGGFSKAGTPSK